MKWFDAKKELPKEHGFYRTLSVDFDSCEDFRNGNFYLKESILKFTGEIGQVLYWIPNEYETDVWISLDDELPPCGETVMACDCVAGLVSLGFMEDEEFFNFMNPKKMEIDVVATHWMPLPKPKNYNG